MQIERIFFLKLFTKTQRRKLKNTLWNKKKTQIKTGNKRRFRRKRQEARKRMNDPKWKA